MPVILETPVLTVTAECRENKIYVEWTIASGVPNVGGSSNITYIGCDDVATPALIEWLESISTPPTSADYQTSDDWSMTHHRGNQHVTETFTRTHLPGLTNAGERIIRITYESHLEDRGETPPRALHDSTCSYEFTTQQAQTLAEELLTLIRDCCKQFVVAVVRGRREPRV